MAVAREQRRHRRVERGGVAQSGVAIAGREGARDRAAGAGRGRSPSSSAGAGARIRRVLVGDEPAGVVAARAGEVRVDVHAARHHDHPARHRASARRPAASATIRPSSMQTSRISPSTPLAGSCTAPPTIRSRSPAHRRLPPEPARSAPSSRTSVSAAAARGRQDRRQRQRHVVHPVAGPGLVDAGDAGVDRHAGARHRARARARSRRAAIRSSGMAGSPSAPADPATSTASAAHAPRVEARAGRPRTAGAPSRKLTAHRVSGLPGQRRLRARSIAAGAQTAEGARARASLSACASATSPSARCASLASRPARRRGRWRRTGPVIRRSASATAGRSAAGSSPSRCPRTVAAHDGESVALFGRARTRRRSPPPPVHGPRRSTRRASARFCTWRPSAGGVALQVAGIALPRIDGPEQDHVGPIPDLTQRRRRAAAPLRGQEARRRSVGGGAVHLGPERDPPPRWRSAAPGS